MVDLTVSLFGKTLKNPLFLPSGIINEIKDHQLACQAGVGCLVLKSITEQPRQGNPIPRVLKFESGFINSVGLRNPGIQEAKIQIRDFFKNNNTPTIISLFADNINSFKRLALEIADLSPLAVELNFSCPNVSDEYGRMLSERREIVISVIKAVKEELKKTPIIAKLSPNVDNIGYLAKACEQSGADAVSAINTLAAGMVIDIKRRKPLLGAKKGGISGPAIKPLAIAKVYEIYQSVNIPILGMGGISTWQDAVEMMMAGASLVGVGSAVYVKGYQVFGEIISGLKKFMEEEKINKVSELIGLAHIN